MPNKAPDLRDLAARYLDLRTCREEMDDEIKEVKRAEEEVKQALIDALVLQELDNVRTADGVSFSLRRKTMYNCPAEYKAQLMEVLREEKMEDLFTVNPSTLNKVMNDEAERNEGVLPEKFGFMKPYETVDISVRGRKR